MLDFFELVWMETESLVSRESKRTSYIGYCKQGTLIAAVRGTNAGAESFNSKIKGSGLCLEECLTCTSSSSGYAPSLGNLQRNFAGEPENHYICICVKTHQDAFVSTHKWKANRS